MKKSRFYNKNFLSVALSIIIFIIIYFSHNLTLYYVDKNILSYYFNLKEDIKTNKNIVVVEIDEKTLQKLWRFPFDRKVYSKLIENLNNAKALVIWMDIIFADKTDLMSDSYFAKSISKAKNIVLWWSTISRWKNEILLEKPLDSFINWSLKIWFFTPEVDSKVNTVYSVVPFKYFKNWYFEYFSVVLLRAFYSQMYDNSSYLSNKSYVELWNFLLNDKVKIPLAWKKNNEVLINYVDRSKFQRYSFYDLYDNKIFDSIQKSIWQDFLKDKIVIIWATAKWIKDVFNTPLWVEYGVFVHANFINTVLWKNFLMYFDENFEWILIFLLTILACYINLSKWWYFLIFSNIAVFSLFLIIFPTIIINFTSLVLNFPAELVIAFLLSSILSNIVKYILENEDKTRLNLALSEYVSPDVANEILSWEWNINLDWEKKRIAVFFSDIEWFTTISEKFSPEELISFLKDYLSIMSEIIMNQRWAINKFEGDAIMALWGVSSKNAENYSYDACVSALLQQKKLIDANVNWTSLWFPKVNVRMWINTWEAIIWNIWFKWKKIEFTAIWDNVNLASRLEWVNKFYWTKVCVSESVFQDTKDFFEFRYLDKIKVKWKNIAINIYELLEYKWHIKTLDLNVYSKFQEWISFYLNREFEKWLEIFKDLYEKYDDKPSNIYKERCEFFIKNPPPDDWDKVWTMTEK